MVTKNPIINHGIHGKKRLALVRLHRLLEFEAAFDGYLSGRVSAAQVKIRAEKMLAIGLPKLRG